MRPKTDPILLLVACFGLITVAPTARAQELPPVANVEIDFAEHIEPILTKTCYRCHADKKQKSEYRLDSREAAIKGGEIGPAIVVGKSAESPLIKYVSGLDEEIEMPPSGDPLTKEQIGMLRAWIDQGVKWSAAARVEVVQPKLEKATFKGKSERITAVAFDRKTGELASAGGQSLPFRPGQITLWNVSTGKPTREFADDSSLIWSVAYSPDGQKLAAGTYNKAVKIFERDTGELLATLEGHKNWVTAVAFSPKGDVLATGSEDATIILWDLSSGKAKTTLSGHAGTVRSVVFSSDGKRLVTGSQDKTIRIWNLETNKETAKLEGHDEGVFSVALSPDDNLIASASADRTVRLWKVDEAKETKKLEGHKNWAISVAFSPRGDALASGGYDKLIKLWDVKSGSELRTFPGHDSAVWSVDFRRDGELLASGSQDGTVKIWDVKTLPKPRKLMRF